MRQSSYWYKNIICYYILTDTTSYYVIILLLIQQSYIIILQLIQQATMPLYPYGYIINYYVTILPLIQQAIMLPIPQLIQPATMLLQQSQYCDTWYSNLNYYKNNNDSASFYARTILLIPNTNNLYSTADITTWYFDNLDTTTAYPVL